MHSILNNLIGNSLKFIPSSGHIVGSVEQKSDRGIILVRDTGLGMDPGSSQGDLLAVSAGF